MGRGFESRLPLGQKAVAHVAQSVEHVLGKDEVTGSIPVVSSQNFLIAELIALSLRRKKVRDNITLECTECKRRNYTTTKNKRNQQGRVEYKKFCRFCNKHTPHKETR